MGKKKGIARQLFIAPDRTRTILCEKENLFHLIQRKVFQLLSRIKP